MRLLCTWWRHDGRSLVAEPADSVEHSPRAAWYNPTQNVVTGIPFSLCSLLLSQLSSLVCATLAPFFPFFFALVFCFHLWFSRLSVFVSVIAVLGISFHCWSDFLSSANICWDNTTLCAVAHYFFSTSEVDELDAMRWNWSEGTTSVRRVSLVCISFHVIFYSKKSSSRVNV